MPNSLAISVGQYSTAGKKSKNQDFYGAYLPDTTLCYSKGICVAIADGISSSDVSHIASESAVKGFFTDYYCTPEAWTVKTSAQRVLTAINSWLYAQSQRSPYRYEHDKGYVCTLSAMVFKGTTAHIFHAGDARIYRLHQSTLEQLTTDHRLRISDDTTYLSRAMGVSAQLDLEYRSLPLAAGDVFILATDGVYEFLPTQTLADILQQHHDLDQAAQQLVEQALANGSDDNLTAQVVRIDQLASIGAGDLQPHLRHLPLPPHIEPRMEFDDYKIVRQIYTSSRSHVYLAVDLVSQTQVAIKIPSVELRNNSDYLERFLLEEWIARRIDNAHVVKPCFTERSRSFLYTACEYIQGQTLSQWLIDHPHPDLESVRNIIEQIAKGLRAFHRLEMLHQDLRPDNILLDSTGTVKIIDFGSTHVAGITEFSDCQRQNPIPGTAQYTAPEYFLGEPGSPASDLFSLGVIAYQMVSGRLPYGAEIAKSRTRAAQRKLVYASVLDDEREIPAWVDYALKKSVHINPYKRYRELSEFLHDLRHPNPAFLCAERPPLLERNPIVFWQSTSLVLAVVTLLLLAKLAH